MLTYNTRIALKSLRRHPLLTAIIIAGIALGICASTTFTTVRHMYARDPLPGRSDRVFFIRMDNWDPVAPYPDSGKNPHKVPPALTYRDVIELQRSNIPLRKTANYVTTLPIFPEKSVSRPYTELVRLCMSDFFPMFDVPFTYGRAWDHRADERAEQVVVLSDAANRKLFGGANSVGKRLQMGDRQFTVVGVLAPWRPFLRMYDPTGDYTAEPETIFAPFSLTPGMQLRNSGNSDNWKNFTNPNPSYEEILFSETNFIQYWVELRSAKDRQLYHRYLDDYVTGQKKAGRFPRPLNNVMTSVTETLQELGLVTPQRTAMAAISILFLLVCALNLTGLVLGKFLARAPEVSVRRALGATKIDIFMQHVVECELVGVVGGTIGMLLSIGVLHYIAKMQRTTATMAPDLEMLAAAVFLSLIAGLVAGLYPAWRICNVQPAMQLKV